MWNIANSIYLQNNINKTIFNTIFLNTKTNYTKKPNKKSIFFKNKKFTKFVQK